jgi:hypothetical protein
VNIHVRIGDDEAGGALGSGLPGDGPASHKSCFLGQTPRQKESHVMAIAVEQVLERKCFRVKDDKPRHVLRIHEGMVTWVSRGDLAWTVLRNYEPVTNFAEKCEAEIDYYTLQDVA